MNAGRAAGCARAERHSWALAFKQRLAAESADERLAVVFDRICDACADEHGLPTLAGLRHLENGGFDDVLAAEWRPIYVSVYRRWIGQRLEHELARGPRPLSLRWWLSPLTILRDRVPAAMRPFTSPVIPLLVVLVAASVLVVPPLVRDHALTRLVTERVEAVEAATARLDERTAVVRGHAALVDVADVEALSAAWPSWRAARDEHARTLERLAAAVE